MTEGDPYGAVEHVDVVTEGCQDLLSQDNLADAVGVAPMEEVDIKPRIKARISK